ncbi:MULTISPECIES: hypothetical protein [Serratia]|uniref:hypothetical protein n=1 Tax=Serratia TaxID=613 RepID=UPI00148E2776|nr:hypothetical protein [Serratia marcescens]
MRVNIHYGVYAALSLCAILAIGIFGYVLFAERDIPECSASLSVKRILPFETVQSVTHINITRSGWRRATIIINGHAYSGGKKQVVARVLEAKYSYSRGYYYITVEKKTRQHTDTFLPDEAKKFLLGVDKQFYVLKIGQLNDGNFVMYNGRMPELLCSATRK